MLQKDNTTNYTDVVRPEPLPQLSLNYKNCMELYDCNHFVHPGQGDRSPSISYYISMIYKDSGSTGMNLVQTEE